MYMYLDYDSIIAQGDIFLNSLSPSKSVDSLHWIELQSVDLSEVFIFRKECKYNQCIKTECTLSIILDVRQKVSLDIQF